MKTIICCAMFFLLTCSSALAYKIETRCIEGYVWVVATTVSGSSVDIEQMFKFDRSSSGLQPVKCGGK